MRLINEAVPRSQLMTRSREVAQLILRCAPLALEASKQVMLQSAGYADLHEAMRARYERAERMLASHDAREGPAAFAAKRKPVWRGH